MNETRYIDNVVVASVVGSRVPPRPDQTATSKPEPAGGFGKRTVAGANRDTIASDAAAATGLSKDIAVR
jgi:hypothetical protein